MATDHSKVLARLRSAGTEAKARQAADIARRQGSATILSPNEVTGEYDAGRMLQTTLGSGFMRRLTHEDLRAFSQNVRTAAKSFKGGITAKAVIDRSTPGDRDRANREIHTAVPQGHKAGRIHFVTNAGPHSDVVRHHVHIELLNYANAISAPGKVTELAKYLAGGPLKFDCDCGRHTFWYRFISTIGGFNAGRPEQGYPKIRNPKLNGIACKHVLRTLHQLTSANMRPVLVKMIEAGRQQVGHKNNIITKAEAERIAKQQADRSHWKAAKVETSAERAVRLGKVEVIQKVVSRQKAAAVKANPAKLDAEKRKFIASAQKMAAAGVLSAKQLAAILASVK